MQQGAHNLQSSLADELALFDELLIPVCAISVDGIIRYFNATFSNFLKLPPRKLRDKPLTAVFSSPTPIDRELIDRAFRDGPVVTGENTLDISGGEFRECILKLIPHQSHDAHKYLIITVQDISIERILHEKHRIQLEELKAKNNEIKKYSEGLEILVAERTSQLRASMQQSERLLLNILPSKIAERLKSGETIIADRYACVSVMFADIVGSTSISSEMDPEQLVTFLSSVFESLEEILDRYGVEKIKTIGDAIMAVAGAPVPSTDHATRMCHAALAMQNEVENLSRNLDFRFQMRIGINSGSIIAGVIGKKKFAYDIWGDVVNVAARMESHGSPAKIQIAEETYLLVKDHFLFEDRGLIDVKGKGPTRAFFLLGPK